MPPIKLGKPWVGFPDWAAKSYSATLRWKIKPYPAAEAGEQAIHAISLTVTAAAAAMPNEAVVTTIGEDQRQALTQRIRGSCTANGAITDDARLLDAARDRR